MIKNYLDHSKESDFIVTGGDVILPSKSNHWFKDLLPSLHLSGASLYIGHNVPLWAFYQPTLSYFMAASSHSTDLRDSFFELLLTLGAP